MKHATVLPGDRLPPCYGVSADRAFYSSEEQYGRPGGADPGGGGGRRQPASGDRRFRVKAGVVSDRNADVMLVLDDNPRWLWPDRPRADPDDRGGEFLDRCGVGGA